MTSPEQVVYLFPRSGVKAGASGFLEARFYWNPHQSSYFQGLGRSDAEAIGSLICRCPERFGVRWDITTEEEIEALHQQRRARTSSLPSSENTTAEM